MSESNGGRRRRSRNRKKNKKPDQSAAPKTAAKGRSARPKVDPVEFWGDPGALPAPRTGLTHGPDVRAVLRSLGRPPIPGQETAAEHWFSLVYERAAFLAGALAAAGELDREHEGVEGAESGR